jgi:predicted dehydrogenase
MRVSICGLGVMGKNHLRVCKKLGFEIVSTYEPNRGDDYSVFLKSLTDVHGLIIANPTHSHTDTIVDAMNANKDIKILCEKPISFSSTDKNKDFILENNNSILVGQIERFNPVCCKLFELLHESTENIIQIKTVRVNNSPAREKIDCRKDIGIHDVDFSCALTRTKPEEINIVANVGNTHEVMSYKIRDTLVINEVSWEYPYKDRRFEVLTTEGVFTGHFYSQTLDFVDWSAEKTKVAVQKREPLELELLHFMNVCLNGVSPLVSPDDNFKTLELMGY